MSREPNRDLMKKVARAMNVVLYRDGALTYPRLLREMGALSEKDLKAWRRGTVPYLERVVNMNLTKLSRVQTAVRRIARASGLVGRLDVASPRRPYSKTRHPFVEREYGMVYRRPISPPTGGAARSPGTSPPGSPPPPAGPRS